MSEGQNLAIANVILKDVYGDINEQINNATPALDGIKSTARNITQVGGLGVKFVAHVGRNTGIGARGEDEDLPEAGARVMKPGFVSCHPRRLFAKTLSSSGETYPSPTEPPAPSHLVTLMSRCWPMPSCLLF